VRLLFACFLLFQTQVLQPDTPQSPTGTDFHEFCWDIVPEPVDVYHVKIAQFNTAWVEIGTVYPPDRCWNYDMLLLPPGLVGVVVTASNEAGDSGTEHYDVFGVIP